MELGEVICTPQISALRKCPVARQCRAYARRPHRRNSRTRRKRAPVNMKIAAAILRDPRGRTMLVQDPGAHDTVLFSRMWQFPAIQVTRRSAKTELEAHLRATLASAKRSLEALPSARHGVTFRNITLLPFLAPSTGFRSFPARASSRLKEPPQAPHLQRHPQNRRSCRLSSRPI